MGKGRERTGSEIRSFFDFLRLPRRPNSDPLVEEAEEEEEEVEGEADLARDP